MLIVDDLALRPMDAHETSDLHAIVCGRHKKASMVVTSNRDPSEWLALLADPLHLGSDRIGRDPHRTRRIGVAASLSAEYYVYSQYFLSPPARQGPPRTFELYMGKVRVFPFPPPREATPRRDPRRAISSYIWGNSVFSHSSRRVGPRRW